MKHRFLGKAAFLFFVLVVLETSARIYLFSQIPADFRPSGFSENARLFIGGGSYVGEYRGKRYLFQKPKNVFRILALGGSTTAGIAGDTETWPHHLEDLLNASKGSRRYEVINLAQSGAASPQEYYYLVTNAYLDPDMVIVYDGYNDLVLSNAASSQYLLTSRKTYELIERRFNAPRLAGRLYRYSALVNRLEVYAYRFKSSLNKLILKNKWFGLGRQRHSRLFNNVEWYASHFTLNSELERLQVVTKAFLEERRRDGKLDEEAFQAASKLLPEGRQLSTDDFARALGAFEAPNVVKKQILAVLGLEQIEFRIGGLTIRHDVLDLTGLRRDQDLFPEIYRLSLENIARFLEERRIPGLFVYQPFLAEKIYRLSGDLKAANLKGLSNFDIESDKHLVKQNLSRKEIARSAAEAHGHLFYDAQSVFDVEENGFVYRDNCHNTDRGLLLLSQRIKDAMPPEAVP